MVLNECDQKSVGKKLSYIYAKIQIKVSRMKCKIGAFPFDT